VNKTEWIVQTMVQTTPGSSRFTKERFEDEAKAVEAYNSKVASLRYPWVGMAKETSTHEPLVQWHRPATGPR
jgi:hypothetical protein